MSYTKGEWIIEYSDINKFVVTKEKGITIAEVFEQANPDTAHYNARLMAAAPELLEALQEMVQWQMDSMSGKSTKGYPGTKSMNAINKALGT